MHAYLAIATYAISKSTFATETHENKYLKHACAAITTYATSR
jgi:hypothetical protein